jgi:hypothetical protein
LEEVRFDVANENSNATAIIGLLVGFLVVGVIGVYVGDQMIAATNLQGTAITTESSATPGTTNTSIGASVTSIDIYLAGGGGGGGAGNQTDGGMGGKAGAAASEATYSSITVVAGQLLNYTIGMYGNGTANASGTAGTATIVYINGVQYLAAGGAGGANNESATINGEAGTAGYGTSHGSLVGAAGTGAGAGTGGAAAVGVGAGGGGGGGAGVTGVGGIGGRGEHGSFEITYYTSDSTANPLATSQQSIVDTFALGVTLCKILVIVSVASIVFMLLQRTGLIPKFGGGDEGM